MTHRNAPMTVEGRRRLVCLVVDHGWSQRRVAERFQVSPATVSRWVSRHRAGTGLADRSSRPHHSPNRLSARTERRIIALRFNCRWGPHRIGYRLRVPRSTVGRVLARYRMPKLECIDQATGLPVRRPAPCRYEVGSLASWSTLMSRSLAASLTVADGGPMAADRARTGRSSPHGARLPVPGSLRRGGIGTCITPSMTTPGWSTPRSLTTRRNTPQQASGSGRTGSSPGSA